MDKVYKVRITKTGYEVYEEFHYDNGPVRIGEVVDHALTRREAEQKCEDWNKKA